MVLGVLIAGKACGGRGCSQPTNLSVVHVAQICDFIAQKSESGLSVMDEQLLLTVLRSTRGFQLTTLKVPLSCHFLLCWP